MDILESKELKLEFLPWGMDGKDLWLRGLGASLQDPYHPQPEPRPMDLFPKAGMTSKFLGRWCWWQFCGQKRLQSIPHGDKVDSRTVSEISINKAAAWAQAYLLKQPFVLGSISASESPTWIPELP